MGLFSDFFKSKPATETTTQTASPWMTPGLNLSQQQLGQPRQAYAGPTYAPSDPATTDSLSQLEAYARGGDPNRAAAQDYYGGVMRGDYLRPEALEQATRGAVGKFGAQYRGDVSRMGRTGSNAETVGLTEGIGNIMSRQYNTERDRMDAALKYGPTMYESGRRPAQQLGQVGERRESIAQQGIDELMQRHQFEQDEPGNRLNMFVDQMQGMGGPTYGTATNVQRSAETSPFQKVLGYGSTALGLMTGNPAAYANLGSNLSDIFGSRGGGGFNIGGQVPRNIYNYAGT